MMGAPTRVLATSDKECQHLDALPACVLASCVASGQAGGKAAEEHISGRNDCDEHPQPGKGAWTPVGR